MFSAGIKYHLMDVYKQSANGNKQQLKCQQVIILRHLILSIALHNWLTTEDNLSLMMTEGCGRVNIQMLGSLVGTL